MYGVLLTRKWIKLRVWDRICGFLSSIPERGIQIGDPKPIIRRGYGRPRERTGNDRNQKAKESKKR